MIWKLSVTPTGVAGLKFLDEADGINRHVRLLRAMEGIHTFVVLIHQGGRRTTYEGPTQPGGLINGYDLVNIVSRLDDNVCGCGGPRPRSLVHERAARK